MFKNKVTIGSVVIIAIAAIVYLATSLTSDKQTSAKLHSFVSPEKISKIQIVKGQDKVELQAKNSDWFVLDKDGLAILADTKKILSVFEFVNDAKILQLASKKESSYPVFELTKDKQTALTMEKTGGDRIEIFAGKTKDYSSQFVRTAKDPKVYLVSKKLNANFDISQWYYKKVLDFDFKNLAHIEYKTDDNKQVKIRRESTTDKMFVENPPKGKQGKNLDAFKDYFKSIPITKYTEPQKLRFKTLAKHNLKFTDDTTVEVLFREAKVDKVDKKYLSIRINGNDIKDENLKLWKTITDKYDFEVSSVDKNKFQKKFAELFEDIPKEEPKKEETMAKEKTNS
jgi:hypothetical protein